MTGNDVMGTASHVFLGGETAEQWEKRIVGSGSHVFLGGETADQWEKRIVGSCNRKSRGLEGETADQSEKWIVGSGWAKPRRKRGLKVQSPIFGTGVGIKG